MNIQRRDFFKLTQALTLTSIAALNFGCSLQPHLKDKNKKVAIVYATRYGSTKDTAQYIAKGLDRKVDLFDIQKDDINNILETYDYLILGSGVWIDGVHRNLIKFVEENKKELEKKILATFIVCGTTKKDRAGEERIAQYFSKFHNPMIKEPVLSDYFGGRMIIDKLNEKDRTLLENFYKRVLKREFKSWDRTEPKKANSFGKTYNKILNLT